MSSLPSFVHLHLHSEYSVVDSLIRIDSLTEAVANQGMPAVALTDQVNFYALIKFYKAAHAAGIKPICGCDVMIVEDHNPEQISLLVLLVKDQTGYRNLIKLISLAHQKGQYRGNVTIKRSWLKGLTTGLIALSGANRGDVGLALIANNLELAQHKLQAWQALFPDSYYLELQRTGRTGDVEHVKRAVGLALLARCPVVATNDVRFLKADEFEAHEARVCIKDRRTLDDPRRPHLYSDQQYLRSPEEMQELFSDLPEALENSVQIAMRCNLELELGKPFLPNYPVPTGLTLEDFFRQLSVQGLQQRLAKLKHQEHSEFLTIQNTYQQRLDFELQIINQMGFSGYFLIVMEFIQWAKDNDIPVGPGRGSGAGSLVAYVLKITDIDPLQYDLLFERFLNPERGSLPDFDVDFCMDGRDRVIEHVANLYGHDSVSQIITFGTMAAKVVIRDVGRVQGKSYALADKLSKLIPFEPDMTLEKARQIEPQLNEFLASSEEAQEIMEMACQLEGLVKNVGKHAGGVVISPTKLIDFTPLYCDESGGNLVTQYDKNDVESAGLVKFDFLGLRTLTIIDWTVKMLNAEAIYSKEKVTPIDITAISLNDPKVFNMLEKGETTAIFQLESRGMKDLIKRLRPSNFEDIIALVALFRPGPLGSGMVDDFIDRKHGRKQVSFPHPDLEPVLKNTYGVILYQEQVMQIAQVLASYSLGGADELRRAMGKKKADVMQEQRIVFEAGAAAKGIHAITASNIFSLMERFADYGFNKSHSAAYALVSYQTAWLKCYYPAHFMAAVLSADMHNTDKIVIMVEESRRMGLEVLPPDVNIGRFAFTVNSTGQINYGLGAIKGLGEGPVDNLIQVREASGPFQHLFDFCKRVDLGAVNKRALEALIRSGAFDSFGADRAILLACMSESVKTAEQNSRAAVSGVFDLFGEIVHDADSADVYYNFRDVRPFSEKRRLQEEKQTLGLYLSGHPVAEYLPELAVITKNIINNLKPEKGLQLIGGIIHEIRTIKSKRGGDTITILTLDDRSARIEVSMFGELYLNSKDLLLIDNVVIVEGVVVLDEYNGNGQLQVKVRQIKSLDQARCFYARSITLNLHHDSLPVKSLASLEALLSVKCLQSAPLVNSEAISNDSDYRKQNSIYSPPIKLKKTEEVNTGTGCSVVINYQKEGVNGSIVMGKRWRVFPDEFMLHQIRELYGADNIVLNY